MLRAKQYIPPRFNDGFSIRFESRWISADITNFKGYLNALAPYNLKAASLKLNNSELKQLSMLWVPKPVSTSHGLKFGYLNSKLIWRWGGHFKRREASYGLYFFVYFIFYLFLPRQSPFAPAFQKQDIGFPWWGCSFSRQNIVLWEGPFAVRCHAMFVRNCLLIGSSKFIYLNFNY